MIPNKQMRKLKFEDATYLGNLQPELESTLRITVLDNCTKNFKWLMEVAFLILKTLYCGFKNL